MSLRNALLLIVVTTLHARVCGFYLTHPRSPIKKTRLTSSTSVEEENYSSESTLPLPVGSLGCPFLGSNIFYGDEYEGPEAFYSSQCKALGNPSIWKFQFLGNKAVLVSGASNIQTISRQEFKNLSSPKSQRFLKDPFAGELKNIVVEKYKMKHAFLRGVIGTALGRAAVRKSMPLLQASANEKVDKMLEAGTIKIGDICAEYVIDVTDNLMLGYGLTDTEKEVYVDAVRSWVKSTELLNLKGQKCIFATLSKLFAGIKGIFTIINFIEKRIDRLSKDGADQTILSHLFFATNDNGQKNLTHSELVQNAIVLTFAGYDTTECVLTLTMFLLGSHPSVWRKIVEEQNSIRSRFGDEMTFSVIEGECSYLSAVLQETLRLGSISITPPRETTETVVIDGRKIPKGWSIVYGIRQTHDLDPVTHREDGSHMNVMTGFDPDRWLHEDTRPRDYIPFGVGPRTCLGKTLASAEIKVFIATLARRVEFELQGSKGDNVKWAPTTVIKKPADGVPVSVIASKQGSISTH